MVRSKYTKDQHAYVELYNGDMFDVLHPEFNDFIIHAAARGLSGRARFAAQSKIHYYVSTHSCLVATILRELGGNAKEGLLHDISEFVLEDVCGTIKPFLTEYLYLDNLIYRAAAQYADLPPKLSVLCHRADKIAMYMEAELQVPSGGKTFDSYKKYQDDVLYFKRKGFGVRLEDSQTAYSNFMHMWKRCKRGEI